MTLTTRSHIAEIDHLRGVAILLTLVAHISAALVVPVHALTTVYSYAEFWGGVYLFFVISGYVITRGFAASFEPANGLFIRAWRDFYRRRFFRIVPTAFFWIICTLVLAGLFNRGGSFGDFHKNLIQAGAAATFAYNFIFPLWTGTFGIYWSLTLEEQFYLVFPVVSRLPTRLRLVLLTLPIILLAFFHRPAGSFLVFLPVDALCWGSLLALAQRAGLLRRLEPSFLRNPLCRTASQVLSILCLVLIPSWMKPFTPTTSIMTLVCVWIVFCASFDKGYARPIAGEWLRGLGLVSFSLYLCHPVALLTGREMGLLLGSRLSIGSAGQNAIAISTGLSLTTMFTLLSYRLIEGPTRRIGSRPGFAIRRVAKQA